MSTASPIPEPDVDPRAQYWLVDPSLEAALDDLTLLAAHLLKAPVAVLCREDGGQVVFAAQRGTTPEELSADRAFFEFALAQREFFFLPDLCAEPRFAHSRLVAAGPRFRSCAGVPLRDSDGCTAGALLVFDREVRDLSHDQEDALRALADESMRQLHVRRELGGLTTSLAEAMEGDTALRATNAALRALIDAAPMAVVVLGEGGQVRMWSARAEAMFGGATRALRLLVDAGPERAVLEAVQRAAVCGLTQEVRCRDHQGRLLEFSVSAAPLRDERGNASGCIGIADDVTLRRAAERRAAAQYATTRALAETRSAAEAASPLLQAIGESLGWQWVTWWSVDDESGSMRCFSFWREPGLLADEFEAVTRQLSLGRGAGLPGRVWQTGQALWIPEIAADPALPRSHAAMAAGLRSAVAFPILRGGRVVGVFDLLSTEAHEPDEALLGTFASISGQVGQFLERARIEDERDQFFSVSLEMLCILSLDGCFRRLNPAWQRTLGYSPDELLGRPLCDFAHPEDREAVRAELARLARGIDTTYFEHRFRAKEGCVRWLSWTCPGVQPGQSVLFAAVRDVTERREAEEALRSSEEQLRQAQKLEATGRLAGWTAHYFNNLLTGILGYSRLMLDRLLEGDPLREYAKQIQSAGERTASLTQQLLAFSRRQVLRPCLVDINAVVADMDRMLRPLIGEDIELVTSLAPGLEHVRADRGQLEQVILNLALNARDAMPQGGRVTIETHATTIDEAQASSRVDLPPGRYCVLSVTDTGVGMDAELRRRVFEPFFTTKRLGQGTGLGLSMVYGIVQQTGGTLRLDSELGEGTRIEIFLPSACEVVERAVTPVVPAATARPTVLLVEDEDTVRELTGEVLRGAGYEVVDVRSGEEALRASRAFERPIDVLLTDVVLQGVNGRQLAQLVTQERPEIKTLYMSGYSGDAVARYGVLAGEAFLAKPFMPDALLQKVRLLVGSRAPTQ